MKTQLLHILSIVTIIVFIVLAYGSDDDDNSSNQDDEVFEPSPKVGETIEILGYRVMSKDLGKMRYEDAFYACKALGKGWHLPNLEELELLLEHKDKIGGFKNQRYWSSSTCAISSYGSLDFKPSSSITTYECDRDWIEYNVRAVWFKGYD
jgi:hypothetical protein